MSTNKSGIGPVVLGIARIVKKYLKIVDFCTLKLKPECEVLIKCLVSDDTARAKEIIYA